MKRKLSVNYDGPFSSCLISNPMDSYSSDDFNPEESKFELHNFSSEVDSEAGKEAVIKKKSGVMKQKSTPARRKSKYNKAGRWSTEEHNILMQALDIYGNNWSELERCVGTRTTHQIRSHLQKHFLKQRKSKIMELSRAGLLHSKLFVVTREYRNIITAKKKFASRLSQSPEYPHSGSEVQDEPEKPRDFDDGFFNWGRENESEDQGYGNNLFDPVRDEVLRLNFDPSSFRDQGGYDDEYEFDNIKGEEDDYCALESY